jgi:rhamnose utilization protein RhaD (predicted bifunctional aldolase and dehydrogenase)
MQLSIMKKHHVVNFGEKQITVKVDYGYIMHEIELAGNFLVKPKNGIHRIHESLLEMHSAESVEDIAARIRKAMIKHKLQLVRVTPEELAHAIKQTLVLA